MCAKAGFARGDGAGQGMLVGGLWNRRLCLQGHLESQT
jgi:hypothetical protein